MQKGTISISFVDAVLQGMRRHGFETDDLLEECGISPRLLELPHARIPSATYSTLLRLIAQVLDDEFFGQDSRRMKCGSFAILCHSVIACKTLDKAMIRATRFYSLCLDDVRVSLDQDGDLLHLTLHDRDPAGPAPVFAHENLLLFLHRLACWLVNRRIPIVAASFRYPEPPHSGEYPLLFHSNLRFGAAQSRVSFDLRYGPMPVVRGERAVRDFLRQAPENLLVRYKDPHSLTARIRRQLLSLPPADWPDFETLIDGFHASASTIRRQLDGEGHSYQQIKDELRRDMAINLLAETDRTVMDIAAALGFAEPSAFHRAFKKWTGASPGEYRRR